MIRNVGGRRPQHDLNLLNRYQFRVLWALGLMGAGFKVKGLRVQILN